ncbi:MAG: glucokinase [bacterium]|nr:MAG: glucokinase [bacterium]
MASTQKRTMGMDLGGTTASFIDMVSPDEVFNAKTIKTPKNLDEFVKSLVDVLRGMLSAKKNPAPAGIGIAIAGQVNPQRKSVIFSPHLPIKKEYPLGAEIEKQIGLPVFMENDANGAAVGEKIYGAAQGMDDFISITLGTGLGSGIFANGKLVTGYMGAGGEAGHMVIDPNGPKCNCGNNGCLETFCSGHALTRMALERMGEEKTGKEICEAAVAGDETAIAILREAGERLGDGLVSLVNLFNPEGIFFCGSLANAPDIYFEPAFRKVREKSFGTSGKKLPLAVSPLKDNIGVIGAAALSALA